MRNNGYGSLVWNTQQGSPRWFSTAVVPGEHAALRVLRLERRDLRLDVDRVADLHGVREAHALHAVEGDEGARQVDVGTEPEGERAAHESTSMPWAMRSPKGDAAA